MWLTGAGDVRMQHAINELRVAASADPTAAIIAGSLAACLTWSDPEAIDLDQIVQAHIKGLHQLAAGSIPYGETAALIDRLRTMTKSLLCIDGDGDNLPIFSTVIPGTTRRGGENSPPSA